MINKLLRGRTGEQYMLIALCVSMCIITQAGRSGRREKDSLSILVAYDSPLDQHLMRHPEFLHRTRFEQALIEPYNVHILRKHVLCAVYEHPLRISRDAAFFGDAQILANVVLDMRTRGWLASVRETSGVLGWLLVPNGWKPYFDAQRRLYASSSDTTSSGSHDIIAQSVKGFSRDSQTVMAVASAATRQAGPGSGGGGGFVDDSANDGVTVSMRHRPYGKSSFPTNGRGGYRQKRSRATSTDVIIDEWATSSSLITHTFANTSSGAAPGQSVVLTSPAPDVSIRNVNDRQYSVLDGATGDTIDQIDDHRAHFEVCLGWWSRKQVYPLCVLPC